MSLHYSLNTKQLLLFHTQWVIMRVAVPALVVSMAVAIIVEWYGVPYGDYLSLAAAAVVIAVAFAVLARGQFSVQLDEYRIQVKSNGRRYQYDWQNASHVFIPQTEQGGITRSLSAFVVRFPVAGKRAKVLRLPFLIKDVAALRDLVAKAAPHAELARPPVGHLGQVDPIAIQEQLKLSAKFRSRRMSSFFFFAAVILAALVYIIVTVEGKTRKAQHNRMLLYQIDKYIVELPIPEFLKTPKDQL